MKHYICVLLKMSYTRWHYRPSDSLFWSMIMLFHTLVGVRSGRGNEFGNKTNFIIIQSCSVFYFRVFVHSCDGPSGKIQLTTNQVIECCFFPLSLACPAFFAGWGTNAYQLNTYLSTLVSVCLLHRSTNTSNTDREQKQRQMHLRAHRHKSKLTRTISKLWCTFFCSSKMATDIVVTLVALQLFVVAHFGQTGVKFSIILT